MLTTRAWVVCAVKALRGVALLGLLWNCSQVCCITEENLGVYSELTDGEVQVQFVSTFSKAVLADLPGGLTDPLGGLTKFPRVFRLVLGEVLGVDTQALELLKGRSPPLALEGRAVFRPGESRTANLSHTEEAIKFSEDLSKDSIPKRIGEALNMRGFDFLGPVNITSIGPATVTQDVKVVVPFDPVAEKKPKEPFFEEHPEVLATAMVLVSLLAGILMTMCWWILREKPESNSALEGVVVDKPKFGTSTKSTGSKHKTTKSPGSKKDPPLASPTDPKNISQLASKNRVEFETLEFIEKIGKGSFKTVFRGRWGSNSVAIVRMRRGGVLVEARLMQKLSSHPNLVTFYRWTRDREGNEYIVMELLPLGSLDVVLRKSRDKMRFKAKIAMCAQICQAMCQLAEEKVLHRDLAARNVLVQSLDPVIVKVSDFGLAKYVSPGLSTSSNILQHLPVRWIPPEVMLKQEWSEKSDVWAFGVTMWEIFSNSREPYAAEIPSDEDVVHHVLNGGRLLKPENCPEAMYHMMMECWHTKPCDRPDFQELSRRFKAPTVTGAAHLDSGHKTWEGFGSSPGNSGDSQPGPSHMQNEPQTNGTIRAVTVNAGSDTKDSVASLASHGDTFSPRREGQKLHNIHQSAPELRERPMGRDNHRSKRSNMVVSSSVKCGSISSIPDPEFYVESDQDEIAAERTNNPLFREGKYRVTSMSTSCKGLLPVEIESPSMLDCRPSFEAHMTIEASKRMRARDTEIEKTPYTDIGDVVG